MLQKKRDGSVSTAAGDSFNLWGKPQGLGGEIQTGFSTSHPFMFYRLSPFKVLDSILTFGEDELVEGLKAFIEAIVNENVSLVISRQLLSEVQSPFLVHGTEC